MGSLALEEGVGLYGGRKCVAIQCTLKKEETKD